MSFQVGNLCMNDYKVKNVMVFHYTYDWIGDRNASQRYMKHPNSTIHDFSES